MVKFEKGTCICMWRFGWQGVKIAMDQEIKRNSSGHIANEIDYLL